jgi:hypothetical protein
LSPAQAIRLFYEAKRKSASRDDPLAEARQTAYIRKMTGWDGRRDWSGNGHERASEIWHANSL